MNQSNTPEYIDEAGFMPEIEIEIDEQFVTRQSNPTAPNPFNTPIEGATND